MADEYQLGGGNWWDSSSRNRFEISESSPSSTAPNSSSVGSFGWPTEIVDTKPRTASSCMDSMSDSAAASSNIVFQDSSTAGGGRAVLSSDPNLQMMGLGLSSQRMDWNQGLLHSEKSESSYGSMVQEDMSSNTSFQGNFQMDSSSMYENPTTMLQGLLGSDNQQPQQSMNYQYQSNYGMNSNSAGEPLPSWSKFPQFLRSSSSPPKQPPQSQLHFSNDTRFWNPSNSPAAMNDVPSTFFPPLQMQLPSSSFEEKPKNTSEMGKKNSNETSTKRPRTETTPSPLPPFKVRKEKMGDRITALQQLVSPFGKTDTASVLSEAIEYIKFLHEQVSVLSTPYMKTGAPIQHQQISDKSKDPEGPKQDLRSRGLCLVPVSSTYPVTHENTVDFWNPTFGGTFR